MIRYQNTLFTHMPKTGGTWVTHVLTKHGGSSVSTYHQPAFRAASLIKREQLAPFCMVRHPIGFVVSIWKHWTLHPLARQNNRSFKKYLVHWDKRKFGSLLCRCIVEGDLEQTFKNFTTIRPGFVSWMYQYYTRECVFVGKNENLREDLANFLRAKCVELPPELVSDILNSPKVNDKYVEVSHKVDAKLIKDFLAAESACQIYGYTFENYKEDPAIKIIS